MYENKLEAYHLRSPSNCKAIKVPNRIVADSSIGLEPTVLAQGWPYLIALPMSTASLLLREGEDGGRAAVVMLPECVSRNTVQQQDKVP